MKNISSSRSVICCVVSLAIGSAFASSDFNNHNHNHNDASTYLYSEIQSLDFDIIYDESDADGTYCSTDETRRNPLENQISQYQRQAPYEFMPSPCDFSPSQLDTDGFEDQSASASIVSSSVLYDGECYVSSEAMMCHGGGGDDNMMEGLADYMDFFEDEEPTDEDDDDDDNDGHSSMLSTASLRRSKSTSRRHEARRHVGSSGTSTRSDKKHTTYTDKVARLSITMELLQHRRGEQDTRQSQQLKHSFLFHQGAENIAFHRNRA